MKRPLFPYLKYQSLGNDFILFDWCTLAPESITKNIDDPHWPALVAAWCNRKTSVGADGVLVLMATKDPNAFILEIYNADGSRGDMCVNGTRCTAQYLFSKNKQLSTIHLTLRSTTIVCSYINTKNLIHIEMPLGNYNKQIILDVDPQEQVVGHIVDVGNPHLLISANYSPEWLTAHGPALETLPEFTNGANVGLIWPVHRNTQHHTVFNMLVHERGVGLTRACGSGATAALTALLHLGNIAPKEKVIISMPGGNVSTWVDGNNTVVQEASATQI